MDASNRQNVVRGHLIIVTSITGKPEVSVAIRVPAGKTGGLHPPQIVSIDPLLKGGLSESDALEYVLAIASLGVGGSEVASR
ncbi:conserved protein of unknown function [Burkholderia multivorans]